MSNPGSTSSPLSMPLRSALKDDNEKTPPLSGHPKAVQIAEPDMSAAQAPPPVEEVPLRKQFSANVAKRLGGRPSVTPAAQVSRTSLVSYPSTEALMANVSSSPMQLAADDGGAGSGPAQQSSSSPYLPPHLVQSPHLQPHLHRRRSIDQLSGRLLAQVTEWIQHEKAKKASRRTTSRGSSRAKRGDGQSTDGADDEAIAEDSDEGQTSSPRAVAQRARAPSNESGSSEVSLDRLQRIIDDTMVAMGIESIASFGSRRRGSIGGGGSGRRHSRSLRYQPSRAASSDAEPEGDVFVPSCDAVLDNSKTLSYAANSAADSRAASDAGSVSGRREEKERQAWLHFKNEIIRLAHTLRLKGWRKVPLDAGETISVERLSGALTNAVYVVSPPSNTVGDGAAPSPFVGPVHPGAATSPAVTPGGAVSSNASVASSRRSQPSKLLLRIYGPQVEHLIDREKELSVLRRLARKKIGPRLLGTFANGRFEQYYNAMTLTAANLREPETSKQIAKRMRELHDGIELLEEERDSGPAVWGNWDHWVDAAEAIIGRVDRAVQQQTPLVPPSPPNPADAWRYRGFVCGVPWPQFRAAAEKYRAFIQRFYGDPATIRDRLVFAHSDTQYGNILRIRPDERSPLLQPSNEHKQLVVIDFEYSAANPRGIEFANHFTEWAYNYHDRAAPYACHTSRYPTPEQQRRFIRAYVEHQPSETPHPRTPRFGPLALSGLSLSAQSTPSTPSLPATDPLATPPLSHSNTTPTATTPTATTPTPTPPQHAASSASSIAEFMLDARTPTGGWKEEERRRDELVERQVDELVAETRLWRPSNSAMWVIWGIVQAKVPGLAADGSAEADGDADADGDEIVEEDGFDYLGYAQDRALFFWGDCVQAGIVRREELPADLQRRIKIVEC